MKPKQVKRYRVPAYPTKLEIIAEPELLEKNMPAAWKRSAEVAGAVSIFLAANGILNGGDNARVFADEKPAIVAPIFEHGSGRGTMGCIIVVPSVFLSEEEALKVIKDELSKYNIDFSEEEVPLNHVSFKKGVLVGKKFDEASGKYVPADEAVKEYLEKEGLTVEDFRSLGWDIPLDPGIMLTSGPRIVLTSETESIPMKVYLYNEAVKDVLQKEGLTVEDYRSLGWDFPLGPGIMLTLDTQFIPMKADLSNEAVKEHLQKEGLTVEDFRSIGGDIPLDPGIMLTWEIQSVPMKADLSNPKRKILVEYVSESDYFNLEGRYSPISIQYYDFREIAGSVAKKVAEKEKDIYFGTFYDPVADVDWKKWFPEDSPDLQFWNHKTFKERYRNYWEEGLIESKLLLRMQVKDFADWLKAQGVI